MPDTYPYDPAGAAPLVIHNYLPGERALMVSDEQSIDAAQYTTLRPGAQRRLGAGRDFIPLCATLSRALG